MKQKKSQNTTKIILCWSTTFENGACPEGKDIHSEPPLKKTDLLFVSEDRLQIVSCLGLWAHVYFFSAQGLLLAWIYAGRMHSDTVFVSLNVHQCCVYKTSSESFVTSGSQHLSISCSIHCPDPWGEGFNKHTLCRTECFEVFCTLDTV